MFLAQKSLLFLGVYGSYDAYVRHGSLAKVERRQKPQSVTGRGGEVIIPISPASTWWGGDHVHVQFYWCRG